MPRRQPDPITSTVTNVAQRARELADTGDRWFLSVADGLLRVGGWARKEADIAADSAVSAFATTADVAKKLTGVAPKRPRSGSSKRKSAPKKVTADEQPKEASDPVDASDDPRTRIGLMAALPIDAWHDGHVEIESMLASLGRNPAGVVPLLQALGRTVADHTRAGYATLQRDERFWTLIHLLQVLGRPELPDGLGADAGPEESAEPTSSQRDCETSPPDDSRREP